jgi:hypothetical protein
MEFRSVCCVLAETFAYWSLLFWRLPVIGCLRTFLRGFFPPSFEMTRRCLGKLTIVSFYIISSCSSIVILRYAAYVVYSTYIDYEGEVNSAFN